jgi:hypothetical protein
MFQPHPNLSNEVNAQLMDSEVLGGIWLEDHPGFVSEDIKKQPVLPAGHSLKIQTANTLYLLEKRTDGFYISGNAKYCPRPVKCYIHGSTWGGSMIKISFVGLGMHLEFDTVDHPNSILTTEIKSIEEVFPEGR